MTTGKYFIAAACLALAAGPAFAQRPRPMNQAIGQGPYQIQQGNVLDANPRLGSGGLNYGVRQYDFNAGNRIMSGNVTGGAGFQGINPIPDPHSLFLAPGAGGTALLTTDVTNNATVGRLPSDSLFSFRSTGFSVADLAQGRNIVDNRLPFYSQGDVTNTGAIIAGLNRPGTSQVESPYVALTPPPRGVVNNPLVSPGTSVQGTLLNVPPRIARIDTGQAVAGPINTRLLASPLFGAVQTVPLDTLAVEAQRAAALGTTADISGLPLDTRVNKLAPLDTRVTPPGEQPIGRTVSPLDRILAASPAGEAPMGATGQQGRGPGRTGQGAAGQPGATPQPNAPGTPGAEGAAGQGAAGQGGTPADVFARMRQAAPDLLRPLERTMTIQEQARADAERGRGLNAPLNLTANPQFGERLRPSARMTGEELAGAELRSFVGVEPSTLNKYLAAAEEALKAGEYYRAAGLYDAARAADPRNPLPLLGRAMSLLAAGDYLSSAGTLLQAINMYQALGHFRVDMRAFIPDLAVLDRRRADLERQLERGNDYRLRFLLGFVEYSTGIERVGIEEMRKAAAAAPETETALRSYVELLQPAPTSRPARAR